MGTYAQNLLERSGTLKGVLRRIKRNVRSVICAFCHGTGRNPKIDTSCPVCRGGKKVPVKPPVVTCLACGGKGMSAAELNCLSCGGIGVVSVSKNAGICKKCHGTGYEGEGIFYCSACKGQGIC